ncbi:MULTISPECIES: hypothetical protein [Pseudomonas]|uniref:hypothetical protein n=1 Tax=Pseudomonas TaxID=286 RepID=UPI001F3C7831|nr:MULTISPECIES: hypothetical protein [Pseudomonas]WHS56556.1 hypothetical protein QLH64_11425 [Pseudomonas brassicacearum]
MFTLFVVAPEAERIHPEVRRISYRWAKSCVLAVGINFPFSGHSTLASRLAAPIRPVHGVDAGNGNKRFSLQSGFRRKIENKFRLFVVMRRFFQHCLDAPHLGTALATTPGRKNQRGGIRYVDKTGGAHVIRTQRPDQRPIA